MKLDQLEVKILNLFIKKMGKEVEGLDLFATIVEDMWPDDSGYYECIVMEKQSNGKVWGIECTRTGNIKSIYEV